MSQIKEDRYVFTYTNAKKLGKNYTIVFLTLELVGNNIFVVTVGYRRKFGIILISPQSIG